VRVTPSASGPESLGQQPLPQRLDADGEPFLRELLTGQCGSEVGVPCPVGLEDSRSECGFALVVGGLAPQSVNQGGIALGFEFALDASDLTDGELEESGGFGLCPLAIEDGLHHLEDIAFTLTHLHTVPVLYPDHLLSPSA
jgi:hypothetical protein